MLYGRARLTEIPFRTFIGPLLKGENPGVFEAISERSHSAPYLTRYLWMVTSARLEGPHSQSEIKETRSPMWYRPGQALAIRENA
jgi:hypothetical protein